MVVVRMEFDETTSKEYSVFGSILGMRQKNKNVFLNGVLETYKRSSPINFREKLMVHLKMQQLLCLWL